MTETDTLPSEVAICAPRRGNQIRYHYFHYFATGHPWPASGSAWTPPVDLYETAEEYVLEVNLGGIATEDVHVQIDGNSVTLSGERAERDGSGTRCYHVMEIERGAFARTVEFPLPVDPDSAQAFSHHGLLIVHVAKRRGGPIQGCFSADSMEGLE